MRAAIPGVGTGIGAVLLCACALLVLPAGAFGAAGHGPDERLIVQAINDVRAQHGLQPVRAHGGLARAADRHSGEMARRGFFSHASSDGTAWDSRVRRYVDANRIGEVLAAFSGSRGWRMARKVVRMWLRSHGHRVVVLDPGFRHVGVGRRRGGGMSFVTADFST